MAAVGNHGAGFVIVEDLVRPGDRRPRRLLRGPALVVGVVVVLAGLVLLLPAMFVMGAVVLSLRLNSSVDFGGDPSVWLWVAGSLVAGYVAIRVGTRLVRGRRHAALFLRRFGFTDATEALSTAVARGLGRRWRLVTLDDQKVAPVGVGGRTQWLFRVTPWLLAAGLAVLLLWVVPPWFDAQLERAIEGAASDAFEQADDPISGIFGALFAALIVGVVVGVMMMMVALVPAALAGSLLLFSVGGRRAIRRAERRRAVVVDRRGQIDAVTRSVRRAANRIYAPRLTVVRCANEVWQDVVRRLAGLTDTVLIDVSEVSGGLLWELDELGPALRDHWALVGRHDRLQALLADPSADASRLRQVLDGQRVLAYRVDDLGRFEASLRRRLDMVA
ncbi:MAG: hypothetical protein AB1673_09520 [Actinomycetota bacterium]|jgi:hypothetical protein